MIPGGHRRAMRRVIAVVMIGMLVLACSSGGDDDGEDAGPTCNETRLATGKGYPWDPGLALAVSRLIEVSHPELSGIINAVADYQEAHPSHQDFENPRRGDHLGEGTAIYLAALLVLAERPDIATPATLDALEQAAEEGGMAAVGNVSINSSADDPPEYNTDAINELRNLVIEREEAVEDAGIVSLPDPRCPPEERSED
jgi:hypothetical protein